MNLLLKRAYIGPEGAFGTLAELGRPPFAVTLEHTYEGAVAVKIPPGTFTCVRGRHVLPSGPFVTFEVTGVAGHDGLLFHKGNVENDSEGCILLGLQFGNVAGVPGILQSASAFLFFMSRQSDNDTFQLTVE